MSLNAVYEDIGEIELYESACLLEDELQSEQCLLGQSSYEQWQELKFEVEETCP